MDFHCLCTDTDCYCTVESALSPEDQDQIILARIMGEGMDREIIANVVCADCTNGWHLYDPNSEERTKKEEIDETDQSQQDAAKAEAGAE